MLGYDYGWLGLVQCEHEQQVVYATRSDGDGQETIHRSVRVPNGVTVDLQVEVSPEAQARFVARVGDVSIDSGCSFRVREGHWIGAELVMFCAAPLGEPSAAALFGPISMNSPESSDRRG